MSDLRGFNVRPGAKGNLIYEIDFIADPAKDEAWAARKRATYPSEVHWRREFLRDWHSSAGEPYFPEFMQDPMKYIRVTNLIDAPIDRGWDFGPRGAALSFSQYSEEQDRLVVLREVLLRNATTHDLRDLGLYLSGELEYAVLVQRNRVHALRYVAALMADPDHRLHPPWFDIHPTPHFRDWAGHEAGGWAAQSIEHESELRTHGQILSEAGIVLGAYYQGPKARSEVFRRLLGVRPDGHPGFIVHPVCRLIIEAWAGALGFRKGTNADPEPEGPTKNGTHEHLFDALGYAAVNTVPRGEPSRVQHPEQVPGGDYRTPWKQPGATMFAIKELLNPNFP